VVIALADVPPRNDCMAGNLPATFAFGLGSSTVEKESRSTRAIIVGRWLIRCLLYSGSPAELKRKWAEFDAHTLQWLARSAKTVAIIDPAEEAALDTVQWGSGQNKTLC
jgi:hypothetical protein